jgi:4-aminobutyrate aminotransferase-like enzyme
MVNNVAVVGHSHPAVLNAAVSQLTMLNTNSRFVYPGLGAFAEEIVTKTVPEHVRHQLNRIVFVNSGSEATDLALRIARTVVSHRRWQARKQHHQQGGEERVPFRWFRDVICMRGGYHGITTASDEVSTTLNDNPL